MSELPPADWYPDPMDETGERIRYWDGDGWTRHVTTRAILRRHEVPLREPTPVQRHPSVLVSARQRWAPPPPRTFSGAYAVGWRRAFDWSGRASRSEYWWFVLGYVLTVVAVLVGLTIGVAVLGVPPGLVEPLTGLAALAGTPAVVAVAARRLHDLERSAAWMLVVVLPVVGAIVLFVLLVTEGDVTPNRYG